MDERYIGLVKETIAELDDIMNVSIKNQVKDVIKSAMGRSVRTKDPMFWPAGMLILGLVEARKRLLDEKAVLDCAPEPETEEISALVSEIDASISRHISLWNDKYGSRIDYIDDALSGAALVKLYQQLEGEGKSGGALASACKTACNRIFGYLTTAPRDRMGSVVYNAERSSSVFADGAGQVAMFLGLYGRCFGDKSGTGFGELQLLNFMKYGCDIRSGLPYHGYTITEDDSEGAGYSIEKKGVLSWGRAAGWLLMGLGECRTVPELRIWHEELSKILLTYQKADGGYAWQIQATDGPLDTSATGMIVYGLWDQELEGDFSHTIDALWASIKNDKVMNCLSSCDDFGVHYQSYGHYPWGQGAVLAALSKIK
ncbi:hypothetical protein D6855_08345 [Butyrivibrio sp. CB08]|uniref:glycoside hydrolase family 88 protein n=1 Tax=Butyrivibrio sp. CB08 TaxID=2364879 RepID=UPI000EA988D6|nr:glycoside hydrolase family 88 protein [Butyrivibrio sp. CB08]RKM59788.1 hypothetical protein D6855_08345 [Butyrivibrio sp. CB08]